MQADAGFIRVGENDDYEDKRLDHAQAEHYLFHMCIKRGSNPQRIYTRSYMCPNEVFVFAVFSQSNWAGVICKLLSVSQMLGWRL